MQVLIPGLAQKQERGLELVQGPERVLELVPEQALPERRRNQAR